jgi:hypothetical protein
MRTVSIVLILLVAFACSENNDDKERRKQGASFNKEIGNRIKLLNNDSVQTQLPKIDPNKVDSMIDTFILISKDIENMNAAVTLSNNYFDSLANRYKIGSHEFIKIKVGMHVDAVAEILKDNELKLFNMILLKNNKGDLLLRTAH